MTVIRSPSAEAEQEAVEAAEAEPVFSSEAA